MYNALDIANYIIVRQYKEKDKYLNGLQLQKILYFVQAEFLVSKGEACFKEKIEARDFGPIVERVYHEFRYYIGSIIPPDGIEIQEHIKREDCELINGILDAVSDCSNSTLLKIIHNQTPWKKAYDNYKRYGNGEITNELLIDFFKERELDLQLIEAVKSQNKESIINLLKQGADPHCNNCKAFHIAIIEKQYEIIQLLIDNGFEIKKYESKYINLAIELNYFDIMKLIQKNTGWNLESDIKYIIHALIYDKFDIARYLIKKCENNYPSIDIMGCIMSCTNGEMADKEKREKVIKNIIENV